MQLFRALLILAAVVQLVSGQQHVHDQATSGGQDDPTAMVASISAHQNSLAESNSNVVYSSSSHDESHSDWQVNLDRRQAINLGWSLDHAKNEALFTLKINTTRTKFRQGSDIFALGFSDYGQIESADFCLLSFDLAHSAQMRDAITNSLGRLRLFEPADSLCRLVEYPLRQPDGDVFAFKFTRPLNTCKENYYTIDNGTTHLLWFRMDGPLVDMSNVNLGELQRQYKQTKSSSFESGLTRVQLAASKVAHDHDSRSSRHPSSSGWSLDVRMENYEIPAGETTYWCKLFKLPHRFEQRKFHITKYEAVIDKGNEHIVHHMELFNCVHENAKQARDLRQLYEDKGGWSGECGAKDRPPASEVCRRVMLAWAMGAKPLEYPEQVGQSIGGHHYSPYVVLEVHYNNVERLAALRDNSGLRFHFTHKLRPFDAGIMEVGLEYTDKNSIPPSVIAPLAGYCVSECTRAAMSSSLSGLAEHDYGGRRLGQERDLGDHDLENNDDDSPTQEEGPLGYLNEKKRTSANNNNRSRSSNNNNNKDGKLHKQQAEGIYIFAAQMHTHLAGVAAWTEQIREGRLVRELQRDNHYSPHFQEIRLLPEPVHLAPGDALIHYCLYDTRQRANITLGGFATSDEMCVTYLHYYPRIELEVCKSSVDSRALDEYFAYLLSEEGQLKLSSNLSRSQEPIEPRLKEEQSVGEKYQSIEWSRRRSRELLEFYAEAPLSVQCNRSNGDRFPGFWNGVTPTKVHWTTERQHSAAGADRRDDPAGLGLAGDHSRWGPQILQYRGQLRQPDGCAKSQLV